MLLKDLYNPKFYQQFSSIAEKVVPTFETKKFTKLIFDKNWKEKELKDRMKHTSSVLHEFLDPDFKSAADQIKELIKELRRNNIPAGFEYMFFPDYIEQYGLHDFKTSVKAMEFITTFTSCEFAVRPFILNYKDQMLKVMYQWSLHENHHVRRLASEGSRPRLPWAMAIPELKKDPAAILPILNNLKCDNSEYVRRSVANSINDIAKDHPAIVLKIAKQWKGISKETDGIIRHGSRTLLKQGHPEVLSYFGLINSKKIKISDFELKKSKIKIGEDLHFSFELKNEESKVQTIRLEYAIHYLRQNGTYSKKVFKISEKKYAPKETVNIQRKQSFRIITTKKFYPGKQKISLTLNGIEKWSADFFLGK